MNGDTTSVEAVLEAHPHFVNHKSPEEWHHEYIRRGSWQPVFGDNPGMKNSTGKMHLISNFPAHGIQLAAGNGHGETVQLLLDAGANVEVEDGDTALAWATWCGRKVMMNQLMDPVAVQALHKILAGNNSKQFKVTALVLIG
mmetsp:Transcript_7293/g.10321  ORF Transcript_7293/g.10321 Transcript_7293/m.10321 type:complete len:142 (+) Transcript_7293:545-970(+)